MKTKKHKKHLFLQKDLVQLYISSTDAQLYHDIQLLQYKAVTYPDVRVFVSPGDLTSAMKAWPPEGSGGLLHWNFL